MKRIVSLFLASIMCFVSCYDDTELRDSINNHENRLNMLEKQCSDLNQNISSLMVIVNALQQKDYVTGVEPVIFDGKQIGYTISFTQSPSITIYHGKDGQNGQNGLDGQDGQDGKDGYTPIIGVKMDLDGVYYWTLDGDFILVDGSKLRVEGKDGTDGQDGQDGQNGSDGQNGVTPKLDIRDGYWYVSYDNGNEWQLVGKAVGENGLDGQDGDSFFQSVQVGDKDVTFILANGETFVLPLKEKELLSITFDDVNVGVLPGTSTKVSYSITGAKEKTVVKALGQNGWSAKVRMISNTSGEIIVSAPNPLVEDEIVVLVYDGENRTIMSSINFVTGKISLSQEAIYSSKEAATYPITVSNNINYTVNIPEPCRNWITVLPQTKAMRDDLLYISLSSNQETIRMGEVQILNYDGSLAKSIQIVQEGSLAPVPKPNQIYYSTFENKVFNVTLDFKRKMNADVIANEYYDQIGVMTFDQNITRVCGFQETDVTKVVLPEGVVIIEKNAFYKCPKLLEVETPSTVEFIDWGAFYYCESLKKVKINGKLTQLGGNNYVGSNDEGVFSMCMNLETVELPEGMQTIQEYSFWNCENLKEVRIPSTLTTINEAAFKGCNNLEIIDLSKRVVDIKESAFEDCYNLKNVVLSEGLVNIPKFCFRGCYKLNKLTLPQSVETIGMGAFGACRVLDNVIFPDNLKSMEQGAFQGCYALQEIVLPQKIESIPYAAFDNCRGVLKLVLPEGLKSIKAQAFSNCWKLQEVTIPSTVEELGNACFIGCKDLRKVYSKPVIVPRVVATTNPSDIFGNNYLVRKIYVPNQSLSDYQKANGWSDYASDIIGCDYLN